MNQKENFEGEYLVVKTTPYFPLHYVISVSTEDEICEVLTGSLSTTMSKKVFKEFINSGTIVPFTSKQNNNMTEQNIFTWYQEQAKRTCPDLGSEKLNLAHMVLGIFSEREEQIKAHVEQDITGVLEETADALWYIANYCTFRNFSLQELYNDRFDFTQEKWEEHAYVEDVKLSKLQDCVKKYIAYNKPLDSEKEKNAIKGILTSIVQKLSEFGLDIQHGLKKNIAKLQVRFPEKFTEENALNRNLEAERKVLEV